MDGVYRRAKRERASPVFAFGGCCRWCRWNIRFTGIVIDVINHSFDPVVIVMIGVKDVVNHFE